MLISCFINRSESSRIECRECVSVSVIDGVNFNKSHIWTWPIYMKIKTRQDLFIIFPFLRSSLLLCLPLAFEFTSMHCIQFNSNFPVRFSWKEWWYSETVLFIHHQQKLSVVFFRKKSIAKHSACYIHTITPHHSERVWSVAQANVTHKFNMLYACGNIAAISIVDMLCAWNEHTYIFHTQWLWMTL